MKKLILVVIIGFVISKWDVVSDYLSVPALQSKYVVGEYHSDKWFYDHKGYEEAVRISDDNGVPIFVYVYADWCKYCKKFKNELLSKRGVKSSLSQFVKVKINPEHSAKDKALYNKWGGRGYPGMLFQSGTKTSAKRVRGPFFKVNNKWKMMTEDEFISLLNKHG